MNFKYICKFISIHEYFDKIKIIAEMNFRGLKYLQEGKVDSLGILLRKDSEK